MGKSVLLLSALIFNSIFSFAQDSQPLLKGVAHISIAEGTIDCDFTLTDIPRVSDYNVLINSGMNIRSVSNLEDNYKFRYEKVFDERMDESFGYYIPDNTGKAKFMPEGLRFRYTGKFPVVKDSLLRQRTDWRGNIAFNGYSIRADGLQSSWYPVFYDIKKGKRYHEVRCEIEIDCPDCKVIYVNGHEPVSGSKAIIKSDQPLELFLFAGDFEVKSRNGTHFLNAGISDQQASAFETITESFKQFYESKLGIKYTSQISYVVSTPTSDENAWMFVAYPTIAQVGWDYKGMPGFFKSDFDKQYMAHEFGHFYFGHYLRCNSVLGPVFNEGFTEYISLQLCRHLFADSIYKTSLKNMIGELKDFEPLPFSAISTEQDYKNRQLYVYNYAPLLFTAIEYEIGEDLMWKWLNEILRAETTVTDFDFLKKTLHTVLKKEAQYNLIADKYFQSPSSLKNVLDRVKSGPSRM